MREIFMYGSVGRAPGDRCLYPEITMGNIVRDAGLTNDDFRKLL